MDNVPWFLGAVKRNSVDNFLVRNYLFKLGFKLTLKPIVLIWGGWVVNS